MSGLDLDDNMEFQRRSWRAQRTAWAILAAVLVAALLGAFGTGPLSWTSASDARSFASVHYDRFQRLSAPATLKIDIPAGVSRADGVAIEAGGELLKGFKIETVRPAPVRSVAVEDGIRFQFATLAGVPATLYIHLRAERIGYFRPMIRIAEGQPIEIPVFVYP